MFNLAEKERHDAFERTAQLSTIKVADERRRKLPGDIAGKIVRAAALVGW